MLTLSFVIVFRLAWINGFNWNFKQNYLQTHQYNVCDERCEKLTIHIKRKQTPPCVCVYACVSMEKLKQIHSSHSRIYRRSPFFLFLFYVTYIDPNQFFSSSSSSSDNSIQFTIFKFLNFIVWQIISVSQRNFWIYKNSIRNPHWNCVFECQVFNRNVFVFNEKKCVWFVCVFLCDKFEKM